MNKVENVAIVLGGTVPHIELIKQLKERGYYTILIDYFDNPPAKQYADEHIKESTLDKETVLKIAIQRKANLVISACVDQANITACYVMEKLGLGAPYSYATAEKITNKGYMKKIMEENGISTSKYIYVDNKENIPLIDITFPVMVKPADSNSANGVKKAENAEEMRMYLEDALEISRNGRAIVEGFVEGTEISAYCFVKDNKAKLLMTAERLSVTEGEEKVIKCYATIAPARISETAEEKIEKIATRIANAFELDNTPLFFQGMVKEDEIYVIEFAPRVGGGISYKTIYKNTGFDIIAATLDSYIGEKNVVQYEKPKFLYGINTVYGLDGVYSHMTGVEELIDKQIIEEMFYHKTAGAVLDNSKASTSRVGAFIVKAHNQDELLEKVQQAYSILDVISVNGESLIRRDLSIYMQLKG